MVTKNLPIAARRDSGETKTRILDALARVIVRDGLAATGINALAREAGADKVLIYRYFGDLDGVYRAYAERSDFLVLERRDAGWHRAFESDLAASG